MTGQAKKPSLTKRVAKAGSWSIVHAVSLNALKLGSNLIMTRLLVPEAFGLIAMVGVLLAGFSLFTDIGIYRSISREPDGDSVRFLRVAWIVKAMRGGMIATATLVAAIALWFLAPIYAPAGTVYANPQLPLLIACAAIVPVVMGFASTNVELAQRNLQMQYLAMLEISAQAFAILAMVTFAWIDPTAWALFAGMVTGAAFKSIGSHALFPGPRMAYCWDAEIASRLWRYGRWLMGSSIFTFFALNAEKLFLGVFLDATTFGILVIALVWVEAGTTLINRLSDGVGFPVISEVMRTRPKDAPRLYRKLQTTIDGICLLAFLILFFGGQLLVDLLYTSTYQVAGTYLGILSLRFLAARFNTVQGLIMNLGNSFAMMVVSIIQAVWICIALPVAFQNFGLPAALLVISLFRLVTVPYALWLVRPYLGAKQISLDVLCLIVTLCISGLVYMSVV